MINGEEKFLKLTISKIKRYTSEHADAVSFFRDIRDISGFSLQDVSFKTDLKYFAEVNTVLSVITTIVVHPHIITSREEIILRSEQAAALTPEMFFATVHDARLWKDKQGEMVPEEVYYFQNIDEIKTYENRFIVYLIDQIADKINEYSDFYSFLVGTLGQDNVLSQSDSDIEEAFDKINTLTKKIKRIKKTYFYREVSKAPTNFTHIEPTNILLKNQAYSACYRFYINHITYGDRSNLIKDLTTFFYVHLMCALKEAGYVLFDSSKSAMMAYNQSFDLKINRPLEFSNENFIITLNGAEEFGGLYVTVKNRLIKNKEINPVTHLLVFDSSVTFGATKREVNRLKAANVTSIDAISPWNMAYLEDKFVISNETCISERDITSKYLADKTRMIKASQSIYEAHCPVCRSKELQNFSTAFRCANCKSEYAFTTDNYSKYVWLLKLRRK